jgi:hypothetical protein
MSGQATKPVADWVYEPPPVPLTPLVGRYAALEQVRAELTRPAGSCHAPLPVSVTSRTPMSRFLHRMISDIHFS